LKRVMAVKTRKIREKKQKKRFSMVDVIVQKGRWIEKIFAIAVILSVISACFVHVNYDLSEYLPDWAPAKEGLNRMEEEFGYPGTARVMVGPVTLYEAKAYKDRIAEIDGVDMVMWADTTTDVYNANIFINYDDIQDYYKDGYAVMDIIFEEGDSSSLTKSAINEMQTLTGDKGYFMGSAVQNKSLNETLMREISIAMALGVVMIAVILCLTTTSWFEPVMFLMVMGIAIIINMGTNLILGTISFLTFSVASILQLAVAMDYSVFLLDMFTKERAKGNDPVTAITNAIHKSLPSILASGATTIIGFVVLMLMRFSIGKDLGFVLAKGIVVSLITVLFLMPSLLLRWGDRIKRTEHKSFMPSFHGLGQVVYRVRYVVLGVVLLFVVPAFTAQNMNSFTFGNSALGSSPGTKVYEDEQQINGRFGKSNLILAVVPNTSMVKEKDLTDALDDLYYVKSVTSLAGTIPEGIPEKIIPKSATSLLHTDNYSRIMIYVKTSDESDFAFRCTNEITSIVRSYYPEDSYITGVIPSTQDIKSIITADYNFVNLLSILGVGLVVLISFKSLIIPIVVLIPIEVAVFFNMAVPYFTGESMLYMGYIIVSCLQLGATVDYSILMTNNYMDARRTYPEKARAIKHTVSRSALSILTSGTILTIAGYGLYFVSSVAAIGGLGHLIGRGALISVLMVLFLLPVLLTMADPLLMKEEAKKIKIEETRQAMKQKKRDLKEQMKQKTVQMMPGQPKNKMEAEQMGPVKQEKKMEAEQMEPVKQNKKIEAEQPSKNIEDEVKENEK
jgi:predicted RND superfamily exporter protein